MGSCITGANRLLVLLGRQLRAVLRADSWERRGGGVGAGSARVASMQSSESRSPYLGGIRPSALVPAAQASEAQSRGQSAGLVCARERSVCEGRAWTLLSTYARTVPHARLSAAESACTRLQRAFPPRVCMVTHMGCYREAVEAREVPRA